LGFEDKVEIPTIDSKKSMNKKKRGKLYNKVNEVEFQNRDKTPQQWLYPYLIAIATARFLPGWSQDIDDWRFNIFKFIYWGWDEIMITKYTLSKIKEVWDFAFLILEALLS